MSKKRPTRIEAFQVHDLMQEIHFVKTSDEADWESDEQYDEYLGELNAKLVELLDKLVALQDKS